MPNKEKGMKLLQISIEERVEGIERLIIFGFLTIATFKTITENQAYFFGINLIILHLTIFFISFPLAFYYFLKITVILSESSGRLGKSVGSYIQKHESKLKMPFRLSLVLLAILIAHYILGKDFSDIIYAIIIGAVVAFVKEIFDYHPKKTKRYYDDNPIKKKKKKLTTQNLVLESKNDT